MFDDRRFEIPELEELRGSLLTAAEARRPAATPRRRRQVVALAVVGIAVLLAALAMLLSSDPLGKKIGVEEALGDIAARIELLPETPADEYVHTTYTVSNVEMFEAGYDRMMQPFGDFTAIARLRYEIWLSREKQGVGRGHFLPPEYPTEKDRATGERVLAAGEKWMELMKTPEGRREYAPIAKRYNEWVMPRMSSGDPRFMFSDPVSQLAQEDEHSTVTPDGKYHVGAITLTQKEVDEFPRDPRAAYDEVHRQMANASKRQAAAGMGIDVEPADYLTWTALTQGAGSFNDTLPADLRATFVAALQFLPGIKALGRETDSTGRPGDVFEWESAGQNNRIVFDARTAIPLETSSTLTDPEKAPNPQWRKLEKGTLMSRWLLEETNSVASAPKR